MGELIALSVWTFNIIGVLGSRACVGDCLVVCVGDCLVMCVVELPLQYDQGGVRVPGMTLPVSVSLHSRRIGILIKSPTCHLVMPTLLCCIPTKQVLILKHSSHGEHNRQEKA